MRRKTFYFPHNSSVLALFFLVLLLVVGLVLLGLIGVAFAEVGFSPIITALILISTFVGSYVNIPVWKIRTIAPIVREKYVSFFGMGYRVPHMEVGETTTTIAVNMGGALIPTVVSCYLLVKTPSVALYALAGVAVVALITHVVARPVKGVGIVTPAFVPPLMAALVAVSLPSGSPRVVAYVAGVLGTLVGADLSNLNVIPKLGAPVASIGGAGTFDGVFLSGIVAVLLA